MVNIMLLICYLIIWTQD